MFYREYSSDALPEVQVLQMDLLAILEALLGAGYSPQYRVEDNGDEAALNELGEQHG